MGKRFFWMKLENWEKEREKRGSLRLEGRMDEEMDGWSDDVMM